MQHSAAPLRLKKDQERRLLAGHCWVYSNEVDTAATPLSGFEPGQTAEIISAQGRWLAHGYVNPNALICARVVSDQRAHPFNSALVLARLHAALALRNRLYSQPFYRLVYGESDGLPGLVVDRYGDLLAVQLGTAGMERERDWILTALEQVIRPRHIVLRNDASCRAIECLPQTIEWVLGSDPGSVELTEGAVRYQVLPSSGQKTGWFYDQADNRRYLTRFGTAARVLDVFCYLGAWGLQAAANGAKQVICVDSSAAALGQVEQIAQDNGVADRVAVQRGDAFDVLRQLRDHHAQFDLVILDPPALIKRRKDEHEGLQAYQRLNQLGLQLVAPGGLLVSSSCSYHLSRMEFVRTVQHAARRAHCTVQLLHSAGQSPDHPIHPAMPETDYLKTLVFSVVPGH
ncbi:class I SAM-dependent rRNA methyltransferase [Rhodoferax sp. 4810]|uniref:Class I SAM-dependent rRNA methyltransferase n=1 Tax=Thiospirillum jenense TaxID=1653858 RepID=A0A839HHI2_9GAMM|nr:class I SAM-dependent rRNA methyltransferase [Thiospirillum jenense]MBB1074798.1 class I SAM-dependent rRNA methyltransferase [Rhodoferax jenense]MBB1126636.1 class I SAM-dependent rRNA methyltransferase [Thiospirillum jenense]